MKIMSTYLDEANVKRLLTEALTADVQPVFPNQTGLVGADATKIFFKKSLRFFPSKQSGHSKTYRRWQGKVGDRITTTKTHQAREPLP